MSCGHDGCTCGPTTDDAATTSLQTIEIDTPEHPQGCCGGHGHTESGHGCRHDRESELT